MRYSLLSQFRGTLLGAALGEIYGSQYKDRYLDNTQHTTSLDAGLAYGMLRFRPSRSNVSPLESPALRSGVEIEGSGGVDTHACPGNQIAVICAESLIRCGRVDAEDLVHQLSLLQQSLISSKNGAASCSEVAVATLPVALFFHESEATLREQLMLASAIWLQANQKQKESQASDFQPGKRKELI